MPPATHVPPQNIEAEESVLGAMLVAEPTLTRVIKEVGLGRAKFYLDRHRHIFDAMTALFADGKPVDELTVTQKLRDMSLLDEAGGKHYVSELAAKVPAAGNAAYYAEMVQQEGDKFSLLKAGQGIVDLINNRNGDDASELHRRALDLLVAARPSAGSDPLGTIRASEIRLRAVKFLDEHHFFPFGSVAMVFGLPGLGKTTYVTGEIAAKVTRGDMPGLDGPRNVVISSAEDDVTVLAARLVAGGADMDRVFFLTDLVLPRDTALLKAKAAELDAALVIVDPIQAHFEGSVDSHRDAATRAVLAPLAAMAAELDLVFLIVGHPKKGADSGLNRISGSIAFGAAARSVVVFGADPMDPDGDAGTRRVIGHLKCNVAPRASSQAAEIITVKISTEDGETEVPRLRLLGASDHSADELLDSTTADERSDRADAKNFLEDLLVHPVRTQEIRDVHTPKSGHSFRTLERAKKELGIKAAQGPDGWYWLPLGQEEL